MPSDTTDYVVKDISLAAFGRKDAAFGGASPRLSMPFLSSVK